MTNRVRIFALLVVMLAIFPYTPSAYGQGLTHTWISFNGDDANPCSRIAPCRTFAGALSKSAAGGEIDMIDPFNAGPMNISKAITIDGGNAQGTNVFASGTNAILVRPNAGTVILRNLRIQGVGGALSGIRVESGSLVVLENCEIYGFSSNGIAVVTSTGTTRLVIKDTRVYNNGGGIQVAPTGGATTVSISGVVASGNGFGIGVDTTGGGTASAVVEHATASENATNGVQVTGTGAVVQIDNSQIQHNATGVNITSPADVRTFKTNVIVQNSTANVTGNLVLTTYQ